jgi:beta-glucosidase
LDGQIVQKAVQVDPETVKHNHEPEKGRQTPEDSALNRKVAASAIVLLRNQDDILPINASKISKVLVCGPNAKVRTVSGGGSAYLTSHYTVTALQGIQSALKGTQVQVDYAPGCYGMHHLVLHKAPSADIRFTGHREMPMFDGWMTSDDGSPGWTARLYNEVGDGSMAKEPISTCVLRSSRVRINDQKPEGSSPARCLSSLFFLTPNHLTNRSGR